MFTIISNKRFLLLSVLSGLLLALSWPERGFPFLIFFAFIPLLIIEESIIRNKERIPPMRFFLFSWITFIIWNGFTTYWIVFASVTGAFLAVFINSFFMAIPFLIMHIIRRRIPANNNMLSLVVLWLTFEYIHLNWELSWSWLNLGNVFARYPVWIQWYEYTGVLGGTFWVLIMNILFFSIIRFTAGGYILKPRLKIFFITAAILFFIVPSTISFSKYYNYDEHHDPVEILIVQPNFDSYESATTHEQVKERIDILLSKAENNLVSTAKFMIFPEGVLPGRIDVRQPHNSYSISRINDFLDDHDSLYLVTGLMAYEFYGPNPGATPTARQYRSTPEYYDIFNAALMTAKGVDYQFYSKSILVPGVEQMPYFKLFKPLENIITKLGGIPGSMGYWEDQTPFKTRDSLKVYVPVCYESIYGEYINKYILQDAELIFIITNDGWWRDTPGYRQHHQYARLRAIETRRSIARAATTGISSFINQRGDILEASSWGESTVLRNNLNRNDSITFYALHGDYLGRFASLITILLLLFVIVHYFMTKNQVS